MKFVSIEQNNKIATVTFDRGTLPNLLNLELIRELTETAEKLSKEKDLLAVIVAGGTKNFSMGFDLLDEEFEKVRSAKLNEQRVTLAAGSNMCLAWENLTALTISSISGWCVGGGLALAVAMDLRIIEQESTIYVPEIERALNMSWGAVPRITNLIGPAKTKQLIILAKKLSAKTAFGWGLVDEITSNKSSKQRALELAGIASSMPPIALKMCKESINSYSNALTGISSYHDLDQFLLTFRSKDFQEALTSFKNKSPANYSGN